MKTDDVMEPVEVYAGTAWHAAMLKSIIENAEIEVFLTDEIMGTFNPWWTSPGGAASVKVFVAKKDFEKAKQIADEYEENIK